MTLFFCIRLQLPARFLLLTPPKLPILLTMPTILAIESSCDDTSAAVLVNGEIRSNVVATQQVHEQYGGVVPELASRAHQQHVVPVVEAALKKAGISKHDLDAVAFTQGPGLLGSLLVGGMFAKTLALALGKPLIAVNHMRAHILAHFIEEPRPQFPFLCLTVSGGHTQLVVVRSALDMDIIGQTTDDAAGEAFDKTAKLLGLPYPGGPHLDKLARTGNPTRFPLPVGTMPGYDFSFSGLKTAVLYFIRKETAKNPDFVQENLADLCASIQHTIIQTLLRQLRRAAADQKPDPDCPGRRRGRQQRPAPGPPGRSRRPELAGLHPRLPVLHRQRRHDCHDSPVSVRGQRLRHPTRQLRPTPKTGVDFSWQLAVGSWQLAVGSWQLAVGRACHPEHVAHQARTKDLYRS